MAHYNRITKKMDVKSPDEFLSFWDHAFHYISDNRERLLVPTLVVAVAAMLGSGLWYYQSRKTAKANMELYLALTEKPRPASADKAAAPDKAATAQETIEKLKAFDAQYGGTEMGRLGRLYRANILFQNGSYDEAAALYKGIVGGDVAAQRAAINLAAVLTQQKKYAEAVAALEKIRATTIFKEEVDYQIARNQEAAGNKSAAKTEYAKFLETHLGSRIISEVKDRMARL